LRFANARACARRHDHRSTLPGEPTKFATSFAFKCHRIENRIYAVNCIDVSPLAGYDVSGRRRARRATS